MTETGPDAVLPAKVIQLHREQDGAFAAAPEQPVLRHPGAVQMPWDGEQQRRPVIPHWLADRQTRRAALSWARRHAGHQAAFHGVRLPWYVGRVGLVHVPVGIGRCCSVARWWLLGGSPAELAADAIERRDHKAYNQIEPHLTSRRKLRWGILGSGLLLSGIGGIWGWDHDRLAFIAGACCCGMLLAFIGRPRDRPYFEAAVVGDEVRKISADVVSDALGRLGIAEMNKWLRDGRAIPMFIGRDGPGWMVQADLPPGVTPGQIMDKRAELASGLRRKTGCVWPEQAPDDHGGKLHLYVADQPLSQARQQPWPLARRGKADLFGPLPFGHDRRGKLVTVTLIFESVLIGAMPRQGKTVAMRILGMGAALDPNSEMHVFELKGTGDLAALEKVAHRYASGADDGTLAACMDSLREVHGYLATRSRTIAGFDSAACPERKVTPELSADRRNRLWPVLFMIDEVQELFESEHAGEAESICLALMKRGPAMGIILAMATQRPDARSLPKRLSANAGIRYCLRIVDEPSNNMILGAGMYAAGYRATMFTVRDKGVGYLAGQTEDPVIVRSFYADAVAADQIAARACALRVAAGTLTGDAADGTVPDVSLLRDVLGVMPEAEAWLESVAERLADKRPALYRDWDARQLGSALRAFGAEPRQLKRGGRNLSGIDRSAVLSALAEAR